MATPYGDFNQPPVITNQPYGITLAQLSPNAAAGLVCPTGLEYLTMIDQVIVKQTKELLEIFTGCETKNKYKMFNSLGQQIYDAQEDNDCCTRICCGPARPFEMSICDVATQREVIHLKRPYKCGTCCPCCWQEIAVTAPSAGNAVLGYVRQECSLFTPTFVVENAECDPIFIIEGPFCACRCCSDVDFKVSTVNDFNVVGHIRKQWSGFVQEAFTDADNFGVTFPMDLDVKLKGALLGATILIDFIYFEMTDQNH